MNVEELEEKISYYASKYYNGEPEISDNSFDLLVDKLRQMKPDSLILRTGWGFEVVDNKVKHKYVHIGSLDKAKTFEDIPEIFKNKTVYISPKLDGLSAVAYYYKGKLVRGVTRGDGEYGKDITDKLIKIIGPNIIDNKFTGGVRGELIINEDNWKLLNEKYNNLISPRNTAAGIINRVDDIEDLQYIDLVVYKVVGQENTPVLDSRSEMLKWLDINFKHSIPECYLPVLDRQSWDQYHEQIFNQFKELGYGLDGLVLTNEQAVHTNNYGLNWIEEAFKFQSESTTTYIEDIEWTLSRTQRMIPVAIVKPVELSGAIIKRATCNNAKQVSDWKLGKGALITITRSNEVIPTILEVIEPSEVLLPTFCPSCKQCLEWQGVDLKCVNPLCTNIESSDLEQWCTNIGETEGLQWTLMKQYLDKYEVTDITTLYNKEKYIMKDLNSRSLSATESKIKEFFNKIYHGKVCIDKALLALNIPRLGVETAKLLGQHLDILSYLTSGWSPNMSYEEFHKLLVETVKPATAETLLANQYKFERWLSVLNENDRLLPIESSANKYIAVTGSLNTMKRKDFETYIGKYGYKLSSNIKNCEYLVNNDANSTSSKNMKAKEYNIPIISEQEFINLLNK